MPFALLASACAEPATLAVDHETGRLQNAYEHCQAEQEQALRPPVEWPPLPDVQAVHGTDGRWTFEGVVTFADGGTSQFWCDMSYTDIGGWRTESIGSKNQP